MKIDKKLFGWLPLWGILLVTMSIFALGCLEYDNTSTTDGSPAPASVPEPVVEEPSPAPRQEVAERTEPEPEPERVPEPQPVEVSEYNDTFRYVPGEDSVRIYIPRQFGMWQLGVLSLRPHVQLWGPTRTTSYPVVVPIGGEELARRAARVSHGSAILIHANTSNETTGPHANATWRIPDPTRSYSGDGTRVRDGERPH